MVSQFHPRILRYRRTIDPANPKKRSLAVGGTGRTGLPSSQTSTRVLPNTRMSGFQPMFYPPNRREYHRARRDPDSTFRERGEGHRLRQSDAQRGREKLQRDRARVPSRRLGNSPLPRVFRGLRVYSGHGSPGPPLAAETRIPNGTFRPLDTRVATI